MYLIPSAFKWLFQSHFLTVLQATLYLFYCLFLVSNQISLLSRFWKIGVSFCFEHSLHPSTHTGSVPCIQVCIYWNKEFFFLTIQRMMAVLIHSLDFCLLNGRVHSWILGFSQQLITVYVHMGISTILRFWCQNARLCKKEMFWILIMQIWKTQEYLWKDEHNLPFYSHLTSGFSFMTGQYFYIPNTCWYQIPF